jgi:hypothetical protein
MHTKADLIRMNADRTLGFNWIRNIDGIPEGQIAKLYPTGDASLSGGRIYVALPSHVGLTPGLISRYNIWQ